MNSKKLISLILTFCLLFAASAPGYVFALRPPSINAENIESGKSFLTKLKESIGKHLTGRKNEREKLSGIFDENTAIPLAKYIVYRKIFLAEQDRKKDIIELLDNPEKLKAAITRQTVNLSPAKIDSLITRQAETIEQAILELFSNASDAQTGRASPIGRFGMGALQMLAFVIDKSNPPLDKGAVITVETLTALGKARKIVFFKGRDNQLYFTICPSDKKIKGTAVNINIPQGLNELELAIKNFLKERLNLFTKMPVYLNEELINPLEGYCYLNGDKVGYEYPEQRIDSYVDNKNVVVEDCGSGISDEVILNKYLIPRIGENSPIPKEQSAAEIGKEVHFFYRPPEYSDRQSACRIVFQVSGINIQSFTVKGYSLPHVLVIQLPSSTRLPVARNEIEIDQSTHWAIKILAEKIAQRNPHHQIALMNGFMQAVKLLDERNKRVGAFKPLLDTAKEVFIPTIMEKKKLILPNDSLFHQIESPADTLFLDEELIYSLSPEQLPGTEEISEFFQSGTLKKAYTVKFKPTSSLTYLSFGPYLLLNNTIYQQYKEHPLLLNLRLNFFVGYGRRKPDKGWILPYSQKPVEKKEPEVAPLLQNYPALKEALTHSQKEWLKDYLKNNPRSEDTLKSLFPKLNAFILSLPEPIRLQVNWEQVLDFKKIIARPSAILNPDREFLLMHSSYFLNRENPQRLTQYLSNLLYAGTLSPYMNKNVFHPLISVIGTKALNYLDAEIFTAVEKTLGKGNLESYEECFRAINDGLPYVENADIKRLILRWLRIYNNDPQAAETFYRLLSKRYRKGNREIQKMPAEQHRPQLHPEKIPDKPIAELVGDDYSDSFNFTGFYLDKEKIKPLFISSLGGKGVKFFTLDLTNREIQVVAIDKPIPQIDFVQPTGLFADDPAKTKPLFLVGGNNQVELITFDLNTRKIERFASFKEPATAAYFTNFSIEEKPLFISFDHAEVDDVPDAVRFSTLDLNSKGIEQVAKLENIRLWQYYTGYLSTGLYADKEKTKPIFAFYEHRGDGGANFITFDLKTTEIEEIANLPDIYSFNQTGLIKEGKPIFIASTRSHGEDSIFFSLDVENKKIEKINTSQKCSEADIQPTDFFVGEKPILLAYQITGSHGNTGRIGLFSLDPANFELTPTKDVYLHRDFTLSNVLYFPKLNLMAENLSGNLSFWDFSDAIEGGTTRSGFASLDKNDDLSGLPSLNRALVRFLKEEKITFVEKAKLEERDKDWKLIGEMNDVSLAMLNYLFDKYGQEIKKNPQLNFKQFKQILEKTGKVNLSPYVNIILSAIESQDKTERVWVREVGIQNPRDAIRKEREEGRLGKEEGQIVHHNFIAGDNWVYSIKDPVGMDFWTLIRYYFPLDESSKNYLEDTGNLGQGNYTLFADFDQIFIRTSIGDGLINEITIENNKDKGPLITSWQMLKGKYKGTEIRRIKKLEGSDPQLESLFIQEALEKYGGAIQSPSDKRVKGLKPDLRDVEILYNGERFNEDIEVVASVNLGEGWGELSLGRAKKGYKRVMQDEIFVKSPNEKELKFVPRSIIEAWERFGGLHLIISRHILLNIPRNGYSQEQKFLPRLKLATLHCLMKAILKDYLERNAPIPAMPPDYFSGITVEDNPQAQIIAALMHSGNYDKISEAMLKPFLQNPIEFFELLSHIPFTSTVHNGETTLHRIREALLDEAKLREAREETVSGIKRISLTDIFKGKEISGEFAEDIIESAGSIEALHGGAIGGLIGAHARKRRNGGKVIDIGKILNNLPKGAKEFYDFLCSQLLQSIRAENTKIIYYYNDQDSAVAMAGDNFLFWNLYQMKSWMEQIYFVFQDRNKLLTEQQKGKESVLWKFVETLGHESQHLKKFERPGDHTHHSDETIDRGFANRMGRALDCILWLINLNAFINKFKNTEKTATNNDAASISISGIISLTVMAFLVLASSIAITNWGSGIQLMPIFADLKLNGFNLTALPVTALVFVSLTELLLSHRRIRMLYPTLGKTVVPSINKIRFFDKAV